MKIHNPTLECQQVFAMNYPKEMVEQSDVDRNGAVD